METTGPGEKCVSPNESSETTRRPLTWTPEGERHIIRAQTTETNAPRNVARLFENNVSKDDGSPINDIERIYQLHANTRQSDGSSQSCISYENPASCFSGHQNAATLDTSDGQASDMDSNDEKALGWIARLDQKSINALHNKNYTKAEEYIDKLLFCYRSLSQRRSEYAPKLVLTYLQIAYCQELAQKWKSCFYSLENASISTSMDVEKRNIQDLPEQMIQQLKEPPDCLKVSVASLLPSDYLSDISDPTMEITADSPLGQLNVVKPTETRSSPLPTIEHGERKDTVSNDILLSIRQQLKDLDKVEDMGQRANFTLIRAKNGSKHDIARIFTVLTEVHRELLAKKPLGSTIFGSVTRIDTARERFVEGFRLSIDQHTGLSISPSQYAAATGNIPVVKEHLLFPFDDKIDLSTSPLASTFANAAARYGQTEVLKLLLEKGTIIEGETIGPKQSITALHMACCRLQTEAAKILLDHGAHLESSNAGKTPLLSTFPDPIWPINKSLLHERIAETVKLLIDYGADVNATDTRNKTALYYVASQGYEQIAKLLLDHGANVDGNRNLGFTPLREAVRGNHIAVVALLLDNGANARAQDQDGHIPYYYAKGSSMKTKLEGYGGKTPGFITTHLPPQLAKFKNLTAG